MASEHIQSPKGTRDFYPEDMRVQNHIFEGWKKVCRAFGYDEYEGPTFEHLELYKGKSGDEIVDQLYWFKDKGDRELALRPELTPTLARMVNQKGSSLRLPVKWFSIPRLFRYERAQRGRLREFFQLNMDIVGCDTVAAEADLIAAVIEMLKGFGLGPNDFEVRISSRKLLSEFLDRLGISSEKKPTIYSALDKRSKIGEDAFRKILKEAGLDPDVPLERESIPDLKKPNNVIYKERGIIQLLEELFQCHSLEALHALFKSTGTELAHQIRIGYESLTELGKLFRLLDGQGYADFLSLDTSVVRGLAYYTGIVFEVYDKGQSMRAIAGGGRYDSLLSSLGGAPVSAVGFGMGDVVLADLLGGKSLLPIGKHGVDYFLADISPQSKETTIPPIFPWLPTPDLLKLAQRLRRKDYSVGYSLNGGKLKKQMAEANEQGAHKLIFFGSDRATEGSYEVKDLGSGEQKIMAEGEL